MKTIKVYEYGELTPEAKERALEWWRSRAEGDIPWQEETIDSLTEAIKAAGLDVADYSIGAYGPSFLRLRSFQGEDLTGKRAVAWLENNLLAALRVPWTGPERWKVAKYGQGYRPGQVKACPFTGYCFDDDLIDALRAEVRDGATVKEAFERLADVTGRQLEAEAENQASEEYFADFAEANEISFFEDGRAVA